VGKASRNRRQKKDRERQRRRAARATGPGWSPGRQRVPSQRELVVTAVSAAVDAVCRGDERGFAEYLTLLAAEQSPGWTQAVSREIAGFLRVSVTAAWRHGWQPAELVRHVGRELGDAHAGMAADMVVDEMRGYSPAMVDDRWAVQVLALGAGVWWGSDAEFLSARSGEPLRVAIELLHLLQHVPVLERLCPLPGTARAGARAAGRRRGRVDPGQDPRAAGEGGVHGVPGGGGGAVGPRAGADGQAQHRSRAARRPVREQGQAGRAAAAG